MHFREILVKDVKLNVEHALGLARIFFLSILWEQILFFARDSMRNVRTFFSAN